MNGWLFCKSGINDQSISMHGNLHALLSTGNGATMATLMRGQSYEHTLAANTTAHITTTQPWDGTKDGKPVKQEAYVYRWRLRDREDRVLTGIGPVTLLR